MDQRVRELDGTLILTSWPSLGTHLEVDLPAAALATGGLRSAPQAPPVRVIIADQNPVLRRGLRACVERSPRIEVAAEAETGQRAMTLIERLHPDVLLLDVQMLRPDEMPVISRLSEQTQVILLACPDDADLVMRALEAGASGYAVHGEFQRDELIQIVLDAKRRPPGPAVPAGGRSRSAGLRPREREVMGLIAEGLTNRQIAARLVISDKTVKNPICSIYQHFGVHDRGQAVSRWLELLRQSAPAPGPLLGVKQRGIGPVEASPPRDRDRRHSRVDVQLAQHILDMGAHSIS
jgi:DNA-binding NarL/FixJ family response regulator